jgi:RHS repeat-associated protein
LCYPQIASITDAQNKTTTFEYDARGNRTAKTELLQPVGPNPIQLVSNYSYDAIYELTQAVLNGATAETYSYDAVGNRLSSLGVSPYLYNESNQLTSTPAAGFSYDANGNTISKTDGAGTTGYVWDYENRLVQVNLSGGGVVSFQYDSFGRRIRKVSASGTSVYVYDGDNQIEELNSSGGVVARYTQGLGIDEPLALYRSGKKYYYHADGLGSIVALTDNHGTTKGSYTYDAFGNNAPPEPPPPPSSVTNPFRYTGRELDSETGLYYYRARYYDPQSGRFLSEDPARFAMDLNFFAYVSNNPVRYSDPLGLFEREFAVQATRVPSLWTQGRTWPGQAQLSARCDDIGGGRCQLKLKLTIAFTIAYDSEETLRHEKEHVLRVEEFFTRNKANYEHYEEVFKSKEDCEYAAKVKRGEMYKVLRRDWANLEREQKASEGVTQRFVEFIFRLFGL